MTYQELKNWASEPFSWLALIFLEITTVATIFLFNPVLSEVISAKSRIALYFLICLLVLTVWEFFRVKLPRANKGKFAIIVAIDCENEKQQQRIKNDFWEQLKKQIELSKMYQYADLFLISGYKARKIIKACKDCLVLQKQIAALEAAKKPIPKKMIRKAKKWNVYRDRMRCELCIFGNTNERIDEENTYFIELNHIVKHRLLDPQEKERLQQEMSAVIHSKIKIPEKYESNNFKVTSDLHYLAAKYILAITAMISGKDEMAYDLFKELDGKTLKFSGSPMVSRIYENSKIYASKISAATGTEFEVDYQHDAAIQKLEESLAVVPHNASALTSLARSYFCVGRYDDANSCISKAIKIDPIDPSAYYSQAFLRLAKGDFQKAINSYKRAFQRTDSSNDYHLSIIDSVIEHIEKELKQAPKNIEYHFSLGYIKFSGLGNYSDSLGHFVKFIELSSDRSEYYRPLINHAIPCIASIKKEIGFTD